MLDSQTRQQIIDIVREAGVLSLRWFDGTERNEISYKSDTDIVTIADLKIESFLHEKLNKILPDIGIVGEEGTNTQNSGNYFVIDPIDGTKNFVRGLPFYAISLALKEKQQTVLGIVYVPALDQMYCATIGKGAWCNNKKIHVSDRRELIKCVAATGFSCIRNKAKKDNMPILNEAVYLLQSIRRFGSAAINLCLVADGKLDLYWELGIQPWDIAAGVFILQEAGGFVTDFLNGIEMENRKEILATNGFVHEDFLKILRKHNS